MGDQHGRPWPIWSDRMGEPQEVCVKMNACQQRKLSLWQDARGDKGNACALQGRPTPAQSRSASERLGR